MGAFDKIRSGISGLDEALDYIRLGDNVVWQISDLEEFRTFAQPFARQAVADGRNVIYIRFAQHEPVLRDCSGIRVCRFNPDEGFEPFAVNLAPDGDFVVNLLQCRPLYQNQSGEAVDLNALKLKQVFFDISNAVMGASGKRKMDVVVQIDPVLYYRCPYQQKYRVVQAIETINDFYKGSGKNLLLMTPDRVGTSSPELGVPVSFRSISNFSAVCEVSDSRAGYMPELSYGSHMFQDLVEARILYGAIYGDKRTSVWNPELFRKQKNLFSAICPEILELAEMIQVYEAENLYFWLDAISNRGICGVENP